MGGVTGYGRLVGHPRHHGCDRLGGGTRRAAVRLRFPRRARDCVPNEMLGSIGPCDHANNNRPDGGNGKNGQLSGPISKVRFNPSEIVHQYWSTMQQRFRPVPFPGSRMWIWYGTYWIGRTHQFDRLPTWGKEIRRYSWRLVQGGLVPETDPNYRVPVERKKGS